MTVLEETGMFASFMQTMIEELITNESSILNFKKLKNSKKSSL